LTRSSGVFLFGANFKSTARAGSWVGPTRTIPSQRQRGFPVSFGFRRVWPRSLRHDPQRPVRQRPLQWLRLGPRRRQPGVPFLRLDQNDRHGLEMDGAVAPSDAVRNATGSAGAIPAMRKTTRDCNGSAATSIPPTHMPRLSLKPCTASPTSGRASRQPASAHNPWSSPAFNYPQLRHRSWHLI
jgi:hypothetical protein